MCIRDRAIVRLPPDSLPNGASMLSSSCIGTFSEATDCLNKRPSCSRAESGRHAIRRRCMHVQPVAVDPLKFFKALLTFGAVASMLSAKSFASPRLSKRSCLKNGTKAFFRNLDYTLSTLQPMVENESWRLHLAQLCIRSAPVYSFAVSQA